MKKFLVTYLAPADAMKDTQNKTPEEMQEAMKPWMEWAEKCGEGLVDMGNPLGNGKAVSQSGVAEGNANLAGYSILQAETMEDAVEMLKGHPHVEWMDACTVEVHEMMPLPGIDK